MNKFITRIFVGCFIFIYGGINHAISQVRWDSLEPATRADVLYGEGPNVMYADSNYLYMAGEFTVVDRKHMQGIARWNGVKWDSMGAGIDGVHYLTQSQYPRNTTAMITYRNKLYVSGLFTSLGKVHASYIGTWNGSAWDSIPIPPFKYTGFPSQAVVAMAVINNKLYIGGGFDSIAGFPCIGIACWNDTTWSSLNFPNLTHFAGVGPICEYNGSIYVGGGFAEDSLDFIARWDGKNWRSVGGGLKGNAGISGMVVYQGELYVAGGFSQSAGNADNNIQRWDGTQWKSVGGGTDYQIFNLMVYNSKLYAMGQFTEAGGIPASGIAEWDGSKWCSLGSVFDNSINASCIYKDSLYIGGGFNTIDNDSIIYIAEWVGGNYTANCSQPTKVNEVKAENGNIEVYPNPNNGNFTLTYSLNGGGNVRTTIVNELGQVVYDNTAQKNGGIITEQLNLGNLATGIYSLRLQTDNSIMVRKVVLIGNR